MTVDVDPVEQEYTVTWTMQVWATDTKDALHQAMDYCRDGIVHGYGATVWFVDTPEGEHVRFDLEEMEDEP